jgi:hypothetical protein
VQGPIRRLPQHVHDPVHLKARNRSPDQQSEFRAVSVAKSRNEGSSPRDSGSQAVSWNPDGLTHSTLIYT